MNKQAALLKGGLGHFSPEPIVNGTSCKSAFSGQKGALPVSVASIYAPARQACLPLPHSQEKQLLLHQTAGVFSEGRPLLALSYLPLFSLYHP